MLINYLKEMRVHHYIKNLLIFVALAFSGCLGDQQKLIAGLWGFLSFSLLSSAIYFINDIRDVKKDRAHPVKCYRPIASGEIPLRNAKLMVLLLFLSSIICNCFIFSMMGLCLLLLYFGLNIGYSFGWKDCPIIDVTILVSGFIIRILYGASITGINVSHWLYLTVLAFAFYFALGKRRNELKRAEPSSKRRVLSYYTEGFLDKNMYMCLALGQIFYALWTIDKNNEGLIWTVPLVLLISMKYSLNIEGESDGDPVEVLLHDRVLLCLCFAYILIIGYIIYFSG